MDARKYLEFFRIAEARIKLKTRQAEQMREHLTSFGVCMDKDQVSHSRNVSVMSDTIASILDIEQEIDQQTSLIMKKKKWVFFLLDQIHPEKAMLLDKHYIHGVTITTLSRELFVSKRHVNRLVAEALADFQIELDKHGDGPNVGMVCQCDVTPLSGLCQLTNKDLT